MHSRVVWWTGSDILHMRGAAYRAASLQLRSGYARHGPVNELSKCWLLSARRVRVRHDQSVRLVFRRVLPLNRGAAVVVGVSSSVPYDTVRLSSDEQELASLSRPAMSAKRSDAISFRVWGLSPVLRLYFNSTPVQVQYRRLVALLVL